MRLSLLHLPWRRPDDFDILLPHKKEQRRAGTGAGVEGERREGQPWAEAMAMTHLAQTAAGAGSSSSGGGVYLTGLVVCSRGESACCRLRVFSLSLSLSLFYCFPLAFLAFPPGYEQGNKKNCPLLVFVSYTSTLKQNFT